MCLLHASNYTCWHSERIIFEQPEQNLQKQKKKKMKKYALRRNPGNNNNYSNNNKYSWLPLMTAAANVRARIESRRSMPVPTIRPENGKPETVDRVCRAQLQVVDDEVGCCSGGGGGGDDQRVRRSTRLRRAFGAVVPRG